jgi:hypothetical protein
VTTDVLYLDIYFSHISIPELSGKVPGTGTIYKIHDPSTVHTRLPSLVSPDFTFSTVYTCTTVHTLQ